MYAAKIPGRTLLDLKIAAKLGIPQWEVERITTAFLMEARQALLEGGALRLNGLGLLKIGKHRYNTHGNCIGRTGTPAPLPDYQFPVTFTKSPTLRRAIKTQLARGKKWQPKQKKR